MATTTMTRRAAAAAAKTNKKEERIKRARMLITGGIGAAQEKTPVREKTAVAVFPKKGNILGNIPSIYGQHSNPGCCCRWLRLFRDAFLSTLELC